MRPAVVNSPAKPCSGACNLLRSLARGPQPRCVLAQALPLPAPRAWRRWPGLEHTHGPHIAAAAAQTAEVEGEAATPLEQFLGWCLANGAEGVGQEGSKAAIFEGQHGERGLVCLQDIEAGEVVLRVPLRLALTEHPSDEESNTLVYDGAPWSVRLAAKLLRLRAAGSASPWYPYLQVLPEVVPCPHTTFSWEDIEAIQYAPMRRDLDFGNWVATSALAQLSPAATGGAAGEGLHWALSIVHSRSFGSPGEGGVAVRMLVPLIDMLNHAGDEGHLGGGGGLVGPAPRDNVRWDVVAPRGEDGEWSMEVTATRGIQAGEELLLSYGERSDDSFFQHYGFVPPRNPHNDVTLFDSIAEAVAWFSAALAGQEPPEQPAPATTDAPAAAAALQAAAQYSVPLGPQPAATSAAEGEVMEREQSRVRLLAGARLDGRLMAAFEALEAAHQPGDGGQQPTVAMAALASTEQWEAVAARQRRFHGLVAARCRQLLAGMPTSLLADLEQLAAWEAGGGEEKGHCFTAALQHYQLEIEAYCDRAGTSLEAPFGAMAVTGEAPAAAAEEGAAAAVVDAGAAADVALLELLRTAGGQVPGEGAAAAAVEEGRGAGQGSMLPVIYRAYKKMITWDAVLAAARD